MKFITPILFAAVAAFTFVGTLQAEDAPVINDVCPIKGKDVDGSKAVEYTATFCCDKCVTKFKADPAKYADKVAAAEEGKCPFSGKDVDADATVTVKIAVCCGGCEKKVAKDPKAALEKVAKGS